MNPPDPAPPQTPPTDTGIVVTPKDVPSGVPPTKDAAGPEEVSPWYLLRASELIAVALLAGTFLLLSRWPLWHSDVWGHLKFGQWIVQHRELPTQEPFSPFTDRQPYVHFQWLTQVVMYLWFAAGERLAGGDELHRLAGGVEMLSLLFALLSFLRCIFLLLAYRRVSGSMPLACVALLLTGAFFGRMQRPQFVGDLFFAVLLLASSRSVLSRRALLLVPVCFVLWANLHGSYAAGLALLGVFFLGRCIEAGRAAGAWHPLTILQDAQVRLLLLAGLVSTAAIALLNPHGPWLLLYTARFSQHPNLASIVEWQSMDFNWGPGPQWGYVICCIVVAGTQILSPRLMSPTRLLLCASFGVFPLFQQRMITWWDALVPWIVLPAWAELGQRLSWSWLHYRSAPTAGKTFLAGFLLVLAVWLSPPLQWLRSHQPRPLERSLSQGTPWQLAAQLTAPPGEKTSYPQLADALKHGYPGGRFQGRIFATETQGDYLLWALPPDYPVLVYTHVHLFPPEHWRECMTVMAGEPGWREILDRHGVNLVVVEAEERPQLAKALKADADWRVVLDETGLRSKLDPRTRLFIAVRKKPLSVGVPETQER
jgi:hypothetical protein